MAKLPALEMAKRVAEKALDECFQGKTLREWIDAVKQTRWIPVSERLPKAGEYIGGPVYEEYRRIGYRKMRPLDEGRQTSIEEFITDEEGGRR